MCRSVSMAIYFLAFMFVLESTSGHSIRVHVLVLVREGSLLSEFE